MAERQKKVGGVTILRRPNRQEAKEQEWDSSEEAETEWPTKQQVESEEAFTSLNDSISVVDSAPKRRGRPPGSKNKGRVPQLTDGGLTLSALALGVVNSGVVSMFGEECKLQPGEKEVLQPPLARIISRLPPGDAAKAAVFIDPLVLIFGLAVWGRRIVLLKTAEKERSTRVSTEEFLRASGISQEPTGRTTEAPSTQFRNTPTTPTNGRIETPNGIPTGGIPTEILRSIEQTDINGQ